jgi:hypothetical protein
MNQTNLSRVALLLFASALFVHAQETERLPIPSAGERRKAEKELKSVFSVEYTEKDPEKLRAFARKLLSQGVETRGNARYVTLSEAARVSSEGLDLETAWGAIDELSKHFKVDAEKLENAILSSAKKRARTPESASRLAYFILIRVESSIGKEAFESALRLAKEADRLGRAARRPDVSLVARSFGKEIPELKKEKETFSKADLSGAIDLGATGENGRVGRYLAFVKGDWEKGLEFLQYCGEKDLEGIARKELAPPSAGDGQHSLAESWQELARKERNSLQKKRYQGRALHWYELALPEATGLLKSKIEKRLEELAAEGLGAKIRPVVKVLTLEEFGKIEGRYRQDRDLAKKGKATASGVYGPYVPNNVFKGNRQNDAWCLNGPSGWFEATWNTPVAGSTLLFFGRGRPPAGTNKWGPATLLINKTIRLEVPGMSARRILLVKLGASSRLIKTIRFDINGSLFPGLATVEIYR